MTFSPRTWVVGEIVTDAMLNVEIRDQFNSMFDAWTTYTPTFVSTGTAPVLGNGTLTGRYMKWGRTVMVFAQFTAGSTTTFGSGNLSIGLPVAGSAGSTPGLLDLQCSRTGSVNFAVGRCTLPSGATTTGTCWWPSVSTIGDWDAWTATVPWTLAAADIVRVYGVYQSAT
ncbi:MULTISPECIES: hypothetical protein [unclassified Streptomyces]|uniref:hypothetical protein n=1 Tax=unclassified Streptomyces TaxID=2593676 RepID=UPI00081D36A0|nr:MULTISPECIES: hypothetical protein [unclassified Streptomyces]MYZ38351.1 hypothetical protein [Streptomyces sp. SID4917]SCF97918.1 hypothetical protein GA0115259_1062113 [Streptomyces sp. MnatMP-M17]